MGSISIVTFESTDSERCHDFGVKKKDTEREALFLPACNSLRLLYWQFALLTSVGVCPVVIHGGGPEINRWLNKLEISPKFENGLRVTDEKTMEIVEMVLMGRVNKQIVRGINKTGSLAVGISGLDGNLIQSRELGDGSHGLVGEVTQINPELLDPLITKGYIPVISSIGSTADGISHNINADFVAGEVAAAINAEKLILLTDTPGILKERDNPNSLVKQINLKSHYKLPIIDIVLISGQIWPYFDHFLLPGRLKKVTYDKR